MILLWGLPGDKPLASVRARLAAMGRTAVLLDQRAVLETRVELEVDGEPRGSVAWGALRIDLTGVKAAYLRPYDPVAVPAVVGDEAAASHATQVFDALRVWSELTTARIVNRMSAMGSNGSKPYQLARIRAAGFAVPETLVTTDPEAVVELRRRHPRLIYKSVSGVRSIVSRLGDGHDARLDAVAACPTQFQEWIPGVDVRVHVVGDEVFACELHSEADDYRYAERQGAHVTRRHFDLPADVADRCRGLAWSLALPVAGIDLRRRPDGGWVCFEVNPSPAFSWFDTPDEKIASRVAGFLAAA